MDRPRDSQKPAKKSQQKKKDNPFEVIDAKTKKDVPASETNDDNFLFIYLVLYNWVSAILWVAILGRVILTTMVEGHEKVYDNVGGLLKWTQTLAATEVVHSSFGVVRASFFTTFMQVASRFVLVWVIVENFPQATTTSIAFTTMLLAWSITESIRYSYFTGKIAYKEVSGILRWLRYNTFVVLYPLGIASEVWLIILATEPAKKMTFMHVSLEKHLLALLSLYAPGTWILFTHMLAQRKKILSGSEDKKTK